MKGILLTAAGIALAVACWGIYGPVLHEGQHLMGNSRLKPLICVGVAYFIVAIIVPVVVLASQGELGGHWTFAGVSWSLAAGAAGAVGAMGIILALSFGGRPIYVMPLVFGGAPVVNTLFAMYWTKAYREGISPVFYAGLILVIAGAATVLIFAPRAPKPGNQPPVAAQKGEKVVHQPPADPTGQPLS
ncbi:MAG: hypothetical protein ACYC6N_10850 [Pirellulaceae bacterium]